MSSNRSQFTDDLRLSENQGRSANLFIHFMVEARLSALLFS
ncbi:hypothetical protein ABFD39_02455 [Streptococcus suis]